VGKPPGGKRVNTTKTNAGMISTLPSFLDAETQTCVVEAATDPWTLTECTTSNNPARSSNKSLADTVSDAMTTFIATVTANVNSLHAELKEVQEVVLQLTSSQSEVDDLRSSVQQMAAQQNMMKELRDAVVSAHRSEVQQLRDIVQQQLTTQQRELEKMSEVIKHIASNQCPPSNTNQRQPSVLQWRMTTNANCANNDELDQSEFPPLPQPSQVTIPGQPVTNKSGSSRQNSQKSDEQLKQEVMAAMYADLKLKQNRENNIIITGLQSGNTSELSSVRKLIHGEFDRDYSELDETIINCKRIGRHQDDKIQPILVTCDSKNTASFLISNAKHLRQSRTTSVRDKIYISADLTPAEAKAAFEMRCRRREQQKRHQEQEQELDGTQQQQQGATASRLIYRSRPRSAATKEKTSGKENADDIKNTNQSSPSAPSFPAPHNSPLYNTTGNSGNSEQVGRHR